MIWCFVCSLSLEDGVTAFCGNSWMITDSPNLQYISKMYSRISLSFDAMHSLDSNKMYFCCFTPYRIDTLAWPGTLREFSGWKTKLLIRCGHCVALIESYWLSLLNPLVQAGFFWFMKGGGGMCHKSCCVRREEPYRVLIL